MAPCIKRPEGARGTPEALLPSARSSGPGVQWADAELMRLDVDQKAVSAVSRTCAVNQPETAPLREFHQINVLVVHPAHPR